MNYPKIHVELANLLNLTAPIYRAYLDAWADYEENGATMARRGTLSATGQAFETHWKILSHAHSRLNQSAPFRTNLDRRNGIRNSPPWEPLPPAI